MVNSIFYNDKYKKLEVEVFECLKKYDFDLSGNSLTSTRGVGDTIENVISQEFSNIISKTSIRCSDYSTDFARRAMADLAFTSDNMYYMVDVKSHRTDTEFNMPNLTSVERLSRFYEDSRNYFVIFLVEYAIVDNTMNITRVRISPIEFLSWKCLTLGALGWGQIQIKNSNFVQLERCSRKKWMLNLCDILINSFYPKEANKIITRQEHFRAVQNFWIHQEDIWK